MTALRLTASARRDVATALAQSEQQFGRAARRRYRLLLQRAFDDLAQDPRRPGVRDDPHLPADHRLYPVRLSRARVATADRVGNPRHVVVFRIDKQGVEVLRLLHEAMDLPRHLPPGGEGL
ncbi:MAG: type II toxin-antitoxin system RelE/ParE family toxin [Caulobacter sp.]|nr:type II toxin-antitoxin system RelE/ParE family toxin [Caulobacter sp.]